jgi:uncharacterized DUF497 family protein
MEYEYDEKKSRANLAKHGIDFVAAQALWEDPRRVEVPARTEDEPRWMTIGRIAGKYWSAVVTRRGKKVRIISVRRSRIEEVSIYEEVHEG